MGDASSSSGSKPSAHAKASSARLAAVQAFYQAERNGQTMRSVVEEYLNHRSKMVVDGQQLVQPDGALLKKILYGVDERRPELEAVIEANFKKDAGDRKVEPLLRAILMCGAYELLVREVDPPIVINDYLNVAHAFYERNEVALVNGVLDSVSSIFQ
ncbi:MAG: transcription antitermination protein NusB [Alphaproteobacteria bacterium]